MDRRQMLGVVGAGVAGLTMAGNHSANAQETGQSRGRQPSNLDQKMQQDLQMMQDCIRICNETAAHCLKQAREQQGDIKDHLENHEHVMDCVQVCVVTSDFMARKSPFSQPMHQANAEVCRRCAQVCENSEDKAEILKACAEICKKCAEMCSRYAQQGGRRRQGTPGRTNRTE